jgi:hypothetical protein
MKKAILTLLLASSCCFSFIEAAVEGERFLQSEEAVKVATYGHIDAKGLKSLIDSQTPFVLLDARGENWHDGQVIPGGQLAYYEDSPEKVDLIIPYKDSLVVVYCFSFTCPLSRRLADKLIEWGYTNVVEYPAGLKEWRDVANYPVDVIQDQSS